MCVILKWLFPNWNDLNKFGQVYSAKGSHHEMVFWDMMIMQVMYLPLLSSFLSLVGDASLLVSFIRGNNEFFWDSN